MNSADPDVVFDDAYWQEVTRRATSCQHCGNVIAQAVTLTGWTHRGGAWQGVRCPGTLRMATPAGDGW